MSRNQSSLFFWINFITLCYFCGKNEALLNIEDLKESSYNIEILKTPIYSSNVVSDDGIKLSSKYGQMYYCNTTKSKRKETAQNLVPADHPIPLMLLSLSSSPCLKKVKGWWTYEYCHNTRIKQYHSEDGVMMGDPISLGDFESNYDWSNHAVDDGTKHSVFKKKRRAPYHSQTYVNGTECGLLDVKRDTEVRFFCDDSVTESYIERIDEPATCSYLLIIKTPLICSHPYTKPKTKSIRADIQCQPIIPKPSPENALPVLELNWYGSQLDSAYLKTLPKPLTVQASSKVLKLAFIKGLAMQLIQHFLKNESLIELSGKLLRKLLATVMEKLLSGERIPTADVARTMQNDIETFYKDKDHYAKNYNYDPILMKNTGIKISLKHIDSLSGEIVDNGDQDHMLRSLENEIGRELEEVGLGAGTKLEVHLISNQDLTGDGSALSTEDSRQFREVLLEVLGGSQFENKEKKRYKDLVENYSILYADEKKKFLNMNKETSEDESS